MQTGKPRIRNWVAAGTLVLGLTAGLAPVAAAQQAPPQQGTQRDRLLTPEDRAAIGQVFWQRIQQRLGLTDQQVTDIRGLVQQRRDAARADFQELMAARRDLRTAMNQPNADPAAVQSAAQKVKAAQNKLFDERLQTQLSIRAKLSPEQWQRWTELRRGMGHRGGMMRRGPGADFGMAF